MDLDQRLFIPHFGFKSLEEYYNHTETAGRLHKIKVPTFFLNGKDDPCINKELYPFKEFENNDLVITAMTEKGGHCSHFTGSFIRPYQWFPALYMEFLEFLENR